MKELLNCSISLLILCLVHLYGNSIVGFIENILDNREVISVLGIFAFMGIGIVVVFGKREN